MVEVMLLNLKMVLKDKRGDVFSGTFICIMIIMVAFTLMSLTFLVNTHYKVTREMEHSLSLVATEQARESYQHLANFDSTYFAKDFQKNLYLDKLKENSYFVYNEDDKSFTGKGFKISNIDIKAEVPDDQTLFFENEKDINENYNPDSGFDIYYTVTAKIDYTSNLMLSDKPVTLSTGSIKFTSSYNYLDQINDFHNSGGNNDFSKYGDK